MGEDVRGERCEDESTVCVWLNSPSDRWHTKYLLVLTQRPCRLAPCPMEVGTPSRCVPINSFLYDLQKGSMYMLRSLTRAP